MTFEDSKAVNICIKLNAAAATASNNKAVGQLESINH
jgi:hypothetical protein